MNSISEEFKIVVADDSPIYRKLVGDTLARAEYATFIAKNGREAIELVSQHQPAVVISDWEMPDITGLELCGQIRSNPYLFTYIILLTSKDEKDNIIKGL